MGEESPKPASTPTGAVFLSYASQDGEAGPGDLKIREQIRTCAILVSIVSAHSQSRLEGHFRRECKLAADRTQDTCA